MYHPTRRTVLAAAAALAIPLVAAGCAGPTPTGSPTTSGGPTTTSTTTVASMPSAGAGAAAVSFPVTVHAANGKVTIPARPTAIVSLSETATADLYAIGAGGQVKAVDKYSTYPKGTPVTGLDGLHPNIEAISSYHPDLVVSSNVSPGMSKQLAALGIPVLSEPAATTLAQAYGQIAQLGQATGHGAAARAEVTKIKGRIAAIVHAAPAHSAPRTYYYELGPAYYSETSKTFIGQLLGLLGLHSIADAAKGAASSGGYPQLNAGFILNANPDYIFLDDTICCHQSAKTVKARPGWSTLPAVKHGRIIALNDNIGSNWGPRIVTLLAKVAGAIKAHPVPPGS